METSLANLIKIVAKTKFEIQECRFNWIVFFFFLRGTGGRKERGTEEGKKQRGEGREGVGRRGRKRRTAVGSWNLITKFKKNISLNEKKLVASLLGLHFIQFSSVRLFNCVQLFATPWIAACQASLSITNSWSLLKLMPIELVMPSSHPILCCPLLFLPPIPPSIRVFSNWSTLPMKWPKYWSFSFSISPSNEHPGLISFRMDWLDLLAVQGTLKSLLQHHGSKPSIFQHSAFFTVQLSHPYMTTEKTIALTRRTFVGKVISLLLNMLSRLVLTFLPRSKCLLISWWQSPSAVILEPKKVKSDTVSTLSPSISHEWWDQKPWS